MATIKLKRRANATDSWDQSNHINTLHYGEPGYDQSTGQIYVGKGDASGNDAGAAHIFLSQETSDNRYAAQSDTILDTNFGSNVGFVVRDGTATYSIDSNTYIRDARTVEHTHLIGLDAATDGYLVAISTSSESPASTGFELVNPSGLGIQLSDLSVTNNVAANPSNLAYNNGTGVFTYTPPVIDDVSSGNLRAGLAALDNSSNIVIGLDGTTTTQIKGNLQVDGTTTTISSSTLQVDDKNVTLAKGSANAGAADGAGISVDCGSSDHTSLTWDASGTINNTASQRFWELKDGLKIQSTGGAPARLELSGTGTSVLSMTKLTARVDVITAAEWTGDPIADAKIASQANWNTAYTERAQWDGGATNLVAATGRTSLGLGTAAVLDEGSGSTDLVTNATMDAALATIDGGTF